MATLPIHIPLNNGVVDDTSEVDASSPGIIYGENLDFSKQSEVRGRPSFVSYTGFGKRILNNSGTSPVVSADVGTDSPDNLPYNFASMFRYKDLSGYKPGIAANGRAWTWEGDRWADRLYIGSSRVDRVAEFLQAGGAAATYPVAVGYNFAANGTTGVPTGSSQGYSMLSGESMSIENTQPGAGTVLFGSACTAYDSSSVAYHCVVGNDSTSNNLKLVVRVGDAQTLTAYTIATDCKNAGAIGGAVDAACCVTDPGAAATFSAPIIWVAYMHSGGGQVNFLRVNAATGAVVVGPVAYVLANVIGFWIGVNLSGGANSLVAGFTRSGGTKGIACRRYNATTLVNDAAGDAQFDSGAANNPLGPVVVGLFQFQGANTAFVAYTQGTGSGGILTIGRYVPATPSTQVYRVYGGANTGADWAIMHQPILVRGPNIQAGLTNTDRVVLGVHYNKIFFSVTATEWPTGTWFALDLTDMNISLSGVGETKTLGTINPGILAQGPVAGTLGTSYVSGGQTPKPVSAIPNLIGNSYRFPSWDFKGFNANGGTDISLGLNEVTIITPKAASIGDETVISGSVPHSIVRGYAFDTCFPMEGPEFSVTVQAGGTLAVGSYTLQCCWKYVDESGTVRRSAPGAAKSATTTLLNQTLQLIIQNPQLNNKDVGITYLEVYSTPVDAAASDPRRLQITIAPTSFSATTTISLSTPVSTTTLPLYTNNGAILQNQPVSAEGGVTVANRRMWVSDGRVVFASKKFRGDGSEAVAWNDDGPLTIRLPSGAGRILSLESVDDKVIILCQNGIYFTQGDGPEDSGLGPDFQVPIQISELGISSELASVATSVGVLFHSSNTPLTSLGGGAFKTGIQGSGGIYLIERNLGVRKVSFKTQDQFATQTTVDDFLSQSCELAFVPEKDLLVINRKGTSTITSSTRATSKLLVLELNSGKWSLWTNPNGDQPTAQTPGTCVGMVGVKGSLWAIFDRSGLLAHYGVGSFEGFPGKDKAFFSGDTDHDYAMLVKTNHIYADGQSGTGWAKVRGITVLGNRPGDAYTEKLDVTQDQYNALTQQTASVPAFSAGSPGVWPSTRDAPEYRLSNQKCSQIQIQIQATPAYAKWSALRLNTIPKRYKAPAGIRN